MDVDSVYLRSVISLFVSSFGLGLAFSAPPGSITAEALQRGLAGGFRSALFVELGALVGDVVWAISALIGVAFLVQNTPARLLLGSFGSLLLLRLALGALRDAWREKVLTNKPISDRGDFVAGMLLSLGNPYAIAFWVGISGAMVSTQIQYPRAIHLLVFLIGFTLAATLWCLVISTIIAWGRRILKPSFFRWVNLFCGLVLGFFGLNLLLQTIQLGMTFLRKNEDVMTQELLNLIS